MREKRKAPGTNVKGAPKDRKSIIEARKEKQKVAKEKRVMKRKREELEKEEEAKSDEEESNGNSDEDKDNDDAMPIFSNLVFEDGSKINRKMDDIKVKKSKGPRDLNGQLRHIEAKKIKLSGLDEDKRKEIENKNNWSRVLALAEGEKVRDDEKMLKKSIKKKKKEKLKSERKWNERKKSVEDGIAERQRKREENIQAKKERNKLKSKKAKLKAGVISKGRKGKRSKKR